MSEEYKSQLDAIIAPEIKDDDFYFTIIELARREDVSTILEIGSSAGGGSTEAFVTGARANPKCPDMYCMEVSKVRADALKQRYANDEFVHCFQLSSVTIDQFPNKDEVAEFHQKYNTVISQFPLEQVIGWLNQDMRYVLEHNANENGIEKIKKQTEIETFDLVLIDGSEFTGKAELNQVYGAKYILLDDINAFKNYENYQRLSRDNQYDLVKENWVLRNGFAVFKRNNTQAGSTQEITVKTQNCDKVDRGASTDQLPIHFFTIVLNGEPYISKHIERFNQLPFDWHWHIVEGVADLKHDTAWGLHNGGGITEDLHDKGRSNDGTTEYLDWLQKKYPENITIYRKPDDVFWDGKREMINAPLNNIKTTCLLWQVDVDELWTVDQITTTRRIFLENPGKTAAFYWCWFYVGLENVVSTRNCYSQNPAVEWLRTWRFEPGMHWAAHEPPILVTDNGKNELVNVAMINPFTHDETERHGLIFQHYAYAIPQQLWFKEKYYGYHNAMEQWNKLLSVDESPVAIKDYLAWVTDETMIDKVSNFPLDPLLKNIHRPTIVIDGVILQMRNAGIVRVWEFLFRSWVESGFAQYIYVIDRGNTAERIPGINYIDAPAYAGCGDHDRRILQDICDNVEADLFLSTYYSYPINTPSIQLIYDMIPEIFGWDTSVPVWKEKHEAIEYASAYMSISKNSADDLHRYFPQAKHKPCLITYLGVAQHYHKVDENVCKTFKEKYGLSKPYFMLCGRRDSYKNSILFFRAMAQLSNGENFDIVCVGGAPDLEPELRECNFGGTVHLLSLPDNEMPACYSTAIALIYPSLYEGFGMPLLEAMACECPVITCKTGSIPEVTGVAACYVEPGNVTDMVTALEKIQIPEYSQRKIQAGVRQAKYFTWDGMAKLASGFLMEAVLFNIKQRTRKANKLLKNEVDISIINNNIESHDCNDAKLAQLNDMAENLYLKGDKAQALSKLNEAFSISERHINTLNNLAVYYWGEQNSKKALEYLGKAYAVDANNEFTIMNLRNILQALGMHDDALKICGPDHSKLSDEDEVSIASGNKSLITNENNERGKSNLNINLDMNKLKAGESLKSYMQRPYIADEIRKIFFIGVHLFEERDWFFSVYKNLESIALFEPIPHINKQLKNMFHLDDRVMVLPYAVSDSVGVAKFNVSNNLYSSSLLPMKEHSKIFPEVSMNDSIEVEQVSLQHIIESGLLAIPDMLYIDVQGAEYMVLSGMDKSLLQHVKIIYTEASTVEMYEGARLLEDIITFLKDDFVFIGFEDMMNTGVHGDALFINKAFINSLHDQYTHAAALADNADIALSKSELPLASEYITAAINAWPYDSEFFKIDALIALDQRNYIHAVKSIRSGLSIDRMNQELYRLLDDLEQQIGISTKQKNLTSSNLSNKSRSAISSKYEGIQISALVSTYASEEFMRECLDDLLAQTVAHNIEIVVIDAHSPEDERSIVEEYQRKYPNIKYIRTAERIGIYDAWNLAIDQASGQYLISCSTNDRLHPQACEKLMEALDNNPDAGITYGNAFLTHEPHETFEQNSVYGTYVWPDYDFNTLLQKPMVGPHAMWRKSLHYELGYFDGSYKAIGDQDFWLRVGEKYQLKPIKNFTTLHWITDDSLSGDVDVSVKELKHIHDHYMHRESYRNWQKLHSIEEIDAQIMAERMANLWQGKPQIILAMYLTEGQESLFENTLESLQQAFYSNWTLKVITGLPRPAKLSTSKGSIEWCQVLSDEQFDQAQLELNNGSSDDWMTFIQPGTVVEPHLFNSMIDHISVKPDIHFIYFDHDIIEYDGAYQQPQFKPDFNYDYLLSYDYVGPLCMIRHSTIKEIGGISFYFQLEHYDMLLRTHKKFGDSAICHIDNILYHAPDDAKQNLNEMRKQLVSAYLSDKDIQADVTDGLVENTCRITYHHQDTPLVSIIIPTRDKFEYLSECVDSLLEKTTYSNYELIIVDNQSADIDTLNYLQNLSQQENIQIIQFPHEFNYAAISNLAASHANGEYLLFLNNDTKIVQDSWLERMMMHAQRQDVAVVGARLAYPETSKVQHAGVVIGIDGSAGHPYLNTAKINETGYMNRLQVDQNYSSVTGACLLIEKDIYHQAEGMDEVNLKVSFNDVDLCLKVCELGYRIVWTPYATCLHHGNISQFDRMNNNHEKHQKGFIHEHDHFLRKWMNKIAHDPAYNRYLSIIDVRSRVETGVVINWDKTFNDRTKILGMPLYGGSGEYRMRGPLRQIAKAGLAQTDCTTPYKVNQQRIVNLAELARTGANTVISHAGIANNALKALKDYKEYLDVFSVFTLDDLITAVPDGNNFKRNVPPEPRKRLREALSYSDRLIVTTEPLADFCRDMIDDIKIIPNSLEDELWLPLSSIRGVSNKPRVGWAGAQQHADDLAFIVDVVKETANEVDWVFFGMCPAEIKDYIAEEHQFLLSFNDYVEKLASLNLDLAIAPLALHPFNEAKSNLRLLEYGVFGWPVICTDIYPYQNAPVKRVQNKKEAWIAAIRERINDLDAAYKEGDELRKWVLDNYMLSNQLDKWANALNIQPLNNTMQQVRRASV